MGDMNNIKNYEALANAIIVQAVLDYKAVYKILLKNPNDRNAKAQAKHIKNFFHSRWFRTLTSVDGEYLIRKVEAEIEEGTDLKRGYRAKATLIGH